MTIIIFSGISFQTLSPIYCIHWRSQKFWLEGAQNRKILWR